MKMKWKYPKALTSLQLKYSTFVCIMSHFPHLHHSVTLWLFLDFSRILRISCSSSKQTSFTSKHTGSYWNPTKAILLKYLLFILFTIYLSCKIDIFQKTYKLNWQIVLLNKENFSMKGSCFDFIYWPVFHYSFHTRSFF